MNRIIVFDTGAGGKLFAEYLRGRLTNADIIEAIDVDNSPYGSKSQAEIQKLTEQKIKKYIGKARAIVLACNTATANAIDHLRKKYPGQLFVGFEPMLKPAAEITRTGVVVSLLTDAAKKSSRYQKSKEDFAAGIGVIEPDCETWARKIDAGTLAEGDIRETFAPYLAKNFDVVILGCTHYVAVKDEIANVVGGKVQIIYPFEDVADYLVAKLKEEK